MENIPDFTKAYSPRKAFKMTRQAYMELLERVEKLEANKPKEEPRKRRTKAEIEADKAKEK